jgi:hypothetical protein
MGASNDPIAFIQRLEDVAALGFFQRPRRRAGYIG